jgi:hypothetical protein
MYKNSKEAEEETGNHGMQAVRPSLLSDQNTDPKRP